MAILSIRRIRNVVPSIFFLDISVTNRLLSLGILKVASIGPIGWCEPGLERGIEMLLLWCVSLGLDTVVSQARSIEVEVV